MAFMSQEMPSLRLSCTVVPTNDQVPARLHLMAWACYAYLFNSGVSLILISS